MCAAHSGWSPVEHTSLLVAEVATGKDMAFKFCNHPSACRGPRRHGAAPAWRCLGAVIAIHWTSAPWAGEPDWLRPDAIAGYVGGGTEYKLKQALLFKYESSHETMYALELDWHLEPESPFNRIFAWAGATLEPVALVAYRDDRQQKIDIYEAAFFANLRWSNFPWNERLTTTIAIGWGVSYTSDITANEVEDEENTDPDEGPQRWLNYLSVEYGFALPKYPQWQLFYRLHHRSGAFGLFAANDVGSNVMGLGLRYQF